MPYSELDQHNKDIDWFFTDQTNRIFHVASAGGQLPGLISENDRNNKQISRVIDRQEPEFDITINDGLFDIIGYQNEGDYVRYLYLESFIFYAKRGIYSCDKSVLNSFESTNYHLVASPASGYLTSTQLGSVLKLPRINKEIDITKSNTFDLFDYFK
ncbi:MAG: hypothetical protein O9353_10620 [Bacteroidia bacterium]|nr:hypothetical protein [Bacteroidia bacterium]